MGLGSIGCSYQGLKLNCISTQFGYFFSEYHCLSNIIEDSRDWEVRVLSYLSSHSTLVWVYKMSKLMIHVLFTSSEPVGVDVGPFVNLTSVKLLENVSKALQVSVSGKRNIGSVVSRKSGTVVMPCLQYGESYPL